VDVRDLRYFIAAAELGQLHRAADRVGRSQPALSKSIARLEQEVGTRLFHRTARGIRLTSAGETLLAHARRLSQGMQEALRDAAETARGETGHVRLGSSPTMADWLLPDVFRRMLKEAPGLTFSIAIGLGDALRKGLRDGTLDLAVAPIVRGDTPEFTVDILADDVLVVAARPNHPLARQRKVGLRQLTDFRWMLPAEALASTLWLRGVFASHALPQPAVQVEVSAKILLRPVLASTDLLTFLSRRDLAGDPTAALVEVDCPDLVMPRQFGLLSDASGYLPAAAARFATVLRAEADRLRQTAPGGHRAPIAFGNRLRKRRNLPA
jgi:DNA-binding transcriptional LysR family regulator